MRSVLHCHRCLSAWVCPWCTSWCNQDRVDGLIADCLTRCIAGWKCHATMYGLCTGHHVSKLWRLVCHTRASARQTMVLCCIVSAWTLPPASEGLRAWRSYTAPSTTAPGQRDYHGSLRSDCTCFLRWGSIMNPCQLEILTIGNKPGIQQVSSCQVMRPAKTG